MLLLKDSAILCAVPHSSLQQAAGNFQAKKPKMFIYNSILKC
jgi:hypothetical protein